MAALRTHLGEQRIGGIDFGTLTVDLDEGAKIQALFRRNIGARATCVHFSAFFEIPKVWSTSPPEFRGYFHRAGMLGGAEDFNWVFFCEPFGVRSNGTYYLGRSGDRSTEGLIDEMWDILNPILDSSLPVITMGSSMGGHAAIYFAAKWSANGAIAVSPHLDLRRAACDGGRWDEIAWAVPGGDPTSAVAEVDTQRLFVDGRPGAATTQVVVQYALDDPGCVADDINRLQQFFDRPILVDVRQTGGHTSDFAPRDWWLGTVSAILAHSALSQRDFERLSEGPKKAFGSRLMLWLRRAPFRVYAALKKRR